jgi:hypothetical protein
MKTSSAIRGAAFLLGLSLMPAYAAAQSSESPFGLGVIAGDPFGLTGKLWLGPRDAIQANLGWRTSIYGNWQYYNVWQADTPYFSLDYVHHSHWHHSYGEHVRFGGHVGIGGGIDWLRNGVIYYYGYGDHSAAAGMVPALRVPIGLDLDYPHANIEWFAELVPMLGIILDGPYMFFDVMADVGFRFYF